jgi:hypothetical protein
MTIHLHAPPMHAHATRKEPERWSFGCRKRLPGTSTFWVMDDPMSYYGPHWAFKCDGCGEDRRLGFGMEWETE